MSESLSIAFTGDLFPNDRFYIDGKPISPEFDAVLDELARADVRHATFLMPLSNRGAAMEKVAVIRADPAISEDVAQLPFDVYSLANNHVFDYGYDALADTIKGLEGGGASTLGAGEDLVQASEPVIVTRGETRIGFVAFSCLVPPGAAATANRPGIVPIRVHSSYQIHPAWSMEEPGEPEVVQIDTRVDSDDEAYALRQIRDLRSKVDILAVSVHWGFGAGERLAGYQSPLGRAFIDAGADVVLGHHVHGVQGVEIYQGRPILFSSGTFIGRQAPDDPSTLSELAQRLVAEMTPDGFIAYLNFTNATLDSVQLVPTSHDSRGLPHLASGEEFERIAARIIRGSEKLDASVALGEGNTLIVKLG